MDNIEHAYDALYLHDIRMSQGDLFAYLAAKGESMEKFIPFFMQSETRKDMDMAWPKVASLNGRELMHYFLKRDEYTFSFGESDMDPEMAEWAAWLYAYLQWYWNIPSATLIKCFTVDDIYIRYPGLHSQDIIYLVKSVLTPEELRVAEHS